MDKQTNKPQGPSCFHPDVPKAVREHLIGEHHSFKHRCLTGTIISSFGLFIVWVSHTAGGFLEWPLHHLGYGLHGLGWIPFFNVLEKKGGKNGN